MKPLFHKSNEEYVYFGEQKVEIPKLTIAKWKLLFETVETLPQTVTNVISTKDSEDFVAKMIVGTTLVIDEMVNMVSVITGLDAEYIENHVDHNEMITYYETSEKE